MIPPSRPIIGLTGGIGSGKSVAAERFATHGITIVDADVIAHQLSAPNGKAIAMIQAEFGDQILTPEHALNRSAMRQLIFSDPQARHRLEAILHPMIHKECINQCLAANSAYVILSAPLLLESDHDYKNRCTRICIVDCPEALQIARVRSRSGLKDAQIQAIMATQLNRKARLAAADDIIDNSGSLSELYAQVDCLHQNYLVLAQQNG